jgi:hypothetical protein
MKIITALILLATDPSSGQPPVLVALETAGGPPVVECFAKPGSAITVAFANTPDDASLLADIYMDGGSLAVPLAKNIPFEVYQNSAMGHVVQGGFKLPESLANGEKPLLLRLVTRPSGSTMIVRLTPRDHLKNTLAAVVTKRADMMTLMVFGRMPGIRTLLDEWKIPYHDCGPNPPGTILPGSILLGSTDWPESLLRPSAGSSLFVTVGDPLFDGDPLVKEYAGSIATYVKCGNSPDWNASPRLHRLLATHLLSVFNFTSPSASDKSPGTPTSQPTANP